MSSPRDDVLGIRARLTARLPDLEGACIRDRLTLEAVANDVDDAAQRPMGAPPEQADPGWQPCTVGELWGREHPLAVWGFPSDGGSTTWLRTEFAVPAEWAGDDVLLALDDRRAGGPALGYEGLLHLDGAVLAGLDEFHRSVVLPPRALTGTHEALVRCSVAARRTFQGFELRRRDPSVWRLGLLFRTLLSATEVWEDTEVALHQAVAVLDRAYRLLDLRQGWEGEDFRASAAQALVSLEAGIPRGGGPRPQVTAIGHAHLDVAWLWPTWRTRQKVAHTVATALHLMERHPEYCFALSAPQTWTYVREDDPQLYQRMLARTAEGRLEPVGVMWLECDANLPSGEALVRQVKHGLSYYAAETGQQPPAAWLPDSFGYSAALPTVLAGFGVRAFLTTKLSWNRVNRMPADTFRWRGVDGSEVLAHFVTATSAELGHPADPQWHTYNGSMTPTELAGLWAHYRGKDVNDELLYLFGHGDGGGGPTEQMVATAELLADLPALPQVRMGRSSDFFARLFARVEGALLPTWSGDLTMEGHRGTYTSQARTKRGNRDLEKAAREAEWANAWAVREGVSSNRQPDIDDAWITLLRNQFHDILPGSSIAQVYVDTAAEHVEAASLLTGVRDHALQALAPADAAGEPLVVSSTPWARTQVVHDLAGRLIRVRAPAYGFQGVDAASGIEAVEPASVEPDGDRLVLRNGRLRVEVDARGEIAALVDLSTGRDVVAPGRSVNALVLYEDRPLMWDAWDIDAYYSDKPTPLDHVESIEAEQDSSGLRALVRVRRRSGATSVEQRLVLDAGSRALDVITDVDWHERNVLLRTTSPFDVAARHATVGRPFGSVELPIHRNTSWEQARFEVVAHGWADLSDGAGGVTLLTDGTYGHSVDGSTLGLSLLKSGAWPDPHADEGVHRFRYALLPHCRHLAAGRRPSRSLRAGDPAARRRRLRRGLVPARRRRWCRRGDREGR